MSNTGTVTLIKSKMINNAIEGRGVASSINLALSSNVDFGLSSDPEYITDAYSFDPKAPITKDLSPAISRIFESVHASYKGEVDITRADILRDPERDGTQQVLSLSLKQPLQSEAHIMYMPTAVARGLSLGAVERAQLNGEQAAQFQIDKGLVTINPEAEEDLTFLTSMSQCLKSEDELAHAAFRIVDRALVARAQSHSSYMMLTEANDVESGAPTMNFEAVGFSNCSKCFVKKSTEDHVKNGANDELRSLFNSGAQGNIREIKFSLITPPQGTFGVQGAVTGRCQSKCCP